MVWDGLFYIHYWEYQLKIYSFPNLALQIDENAFCAYRN